MDVGLILQLVIKGISTLRTRYKKIETNEKECASLEKLIDMLNRCIRVTKKEGASSSSTKAKSKPLPLVVKLAEVQKTLDEWSSERSIFFLMFTVTDRTAKLDALKQEVTDALTLHNFERQERHLEIQELILKELKAQHKQPPSVKDAKGTSTKDSKPSNEGKPRQRRSASVEARKVPRENREVGPKDSNDQRPLRPPSPRHHEPKSKTLESSKVHPKNREGGPKDSNHKGSSGSTHHQPKRDTHTHTWVYLWAPIDSEKQAKDVEDKLRNSRDVKVEKVSCDQPIKKVMVKVKAVEVKDKSKLNQTLLREARDALARDKPLPTLWKNRPR